MTTAANSTGEWGGTISAEKLLNDLSRLARKLPKPDLFLSTRLFSGPGAMIVEGGAEKFTVAHPMFWARLEHECRRDDPYRPPNLLGGPLPPFAGIPILEIDYHETDTPERRIYIEGIWKRLKEACEVAMTELPDWLKAAPKFGTHG